MIAKIGLIAILVAASGCDLVPITSGSAAKSVKRGRLSMKMESDYEFAARALPANIKTVETFHAAAPKNIMIPGLLAEAYCQYATGFAEDEWEVARFINKDFDRAEELAVRTTKMYVRCMNYGLKMLGGKWKEKIFTSTVEEVDAMIAKVGKDKRDGLMWFAIGLGGQIKMNKDNIDLVAQLPTVSGSLQRVIAIDAKHKPKLLGLEALPHLAIGMFYAAQSKAMGGDHMKAQHHFDKLFELTKNDAGKVKYLMGKVNFARTLLVAQQKKDAFRATLQDVLRTPGSIWPEERLANEVAHRKAKRYLKLEKDWF